jgi:hypothetical protein
MCTCAMYESRGGIQRDVTANPKRLPFNTPSLATVVFSESGPRRTVASSFNRLSVAGHTTLSWSVIKGGSGRSWWDYIGDDMLLSGASVICFWGG